MFLRKLFISNEKSDFINNTIILIGGISISQILPFIFSPLISRLFTTEDFSVYGVYISLYSIMGAIGTLGYEMSMMLPKDTKKAEAILMLCLFNSVILNVFFLFIILVFGNIIVNILKLQSLKSFLVLMPFSALALTVNTVLINWFNRNEQYKTISLNRISRNSILTGSNIVLGLLKTGPGGLVLSQFISDIISAGYYLITYYFRVLKRAIIFRFEEIKAVAGEYKEFPFFTLPATFIDTFSNQLPILLITSYFSSSKSGSYFFALRILAIPIALIGSAYAQTFFQKFVSYIQLENYQGAQTFLYRSWLSLFSLIVLPGAILVFWGEALFSFIFGSEWAESGAIASVLIFYIIFSFVSSPTSSSYVALRMQKYSLFFGVSVLIYRFLAFYIGHLTSDFYLALTILVTCEVIEIMVYNGVVLVKLKRLSGSV